MEFDGHVCIVTGAASGIGEEIAKRFAAQGAAVAVVDIQETKAKKVAENITSSGPGTATAYSCDLRSVAEIVNTVDAVYRDFGRIDVLVNAAGLANRTPSEDVTEEEWDLLNDVNLKGPFFAAQQVYKVMLKQQSGKIINIASHRATTTDGRHLVYAATKAGIQAVTRDLAIAAAPHGISVNSLSPGYVITPMTAHNLQNKEWLGNMQQRIPVGRLLEMSEVANAALFLASPKTSGIIGHNLLVDGGWTIHE